MSKKNRYNNINVNSPNNELEEIMDKEVKDNSVVDTNTAPNNDHNDIPSFTTGSFQNSNEAINTPEVETTLEAPVEVEPKVEVKPTKAPEVVKQKAIVEEPKGDVVIENARTSSNSYLKVMNGTLNNYITKLAPGIRVDPKIGASIQFGLYNTIFLTFNKPSYEEFKQGMLLLLAYFDKHQNGCFSEVYLFRFSEEWGSSTDKLVSFHATLNLLKVISTPKERPISKFVDLEAVFNTGYTETARDNIMKFLS